VSYSHSACQPSVIVRISSSSNAFTRDGMPSFLVEMQGKRLIVDVSDPIATSAAVTVECDDAMFLGEVVAATAQNGRYHVEIAVEQRLSGLQSLMALRAQLLGENVPASRATEKVADLQRA
jgi:hypothetical protein